MVGELERASQGKLLIAAARAGRAREVDTDFAYRDETEAAVLGAESVEAVEEIARRVGVIPIVAAVINDDFVSGFSREGASVLNQVVAGEQNLENGIAKGRIFAAHAGRRSDAARPCGVSPWEPG